MTVPAPLPPQAAESDSAQTDRPDFVAGVDERPQRRREWAGGLRSVVLPVLAIAAIVGAVWYFQSGRDSGLPREDGIGIVALPDGLNQTGRPPAVEVGRVAPDFVLRTLDGGTLRLSDLRGQVVLINFWASWCPPCRQEMPEIVRAHATDAGRGLRVVAVDLQESADQVQPFADQFGMRFPIVFDRTGAVAQLYRANKELPTSVFVDRDGIIREIKFGPMTADYLRGQLAALLEPA